MCLNLLELSPEPTSSSRLSVTIVGFFGKKFESNWMLLNSQAMVSVTVASANVRKVGLGTRASTQLTVT